MVDTSRLRCTLQATGVRLANAELRPENTADKIVYEAIPIGVLVMAYGGPNSLAELPGYLADIRSGRPTTPAVLEEISNNYEQIGGKSPLLASQNSR